MILLFKRSFGCVLFEMTKLKRLFNHQNETLNFDVDNDLNHENIEPFFVSILKK